MKTQKNLNKVAGNCIVVVFLLTLSCQIIRPRESNDLRDFKILIEKTDRGIKMQGLEGTAWIDIEFSINENQPQVINQFGMTEVGEKSSEKDPNLAAFLFTVAKTESGIVLKGIEGTVWTSLSFSLASNGQQEAIDQNGMISLN